MDARVTPADASRNDDEDDNLLDIARKRVGVRGRLTRSVGFELEAEAVAANPWRDGFVEYRQFRAIRVRAGRFKVPFSLDQTTASTNLDFVDRSRAATKLALGRDEGVMAHGRVWRKRLEYELGAFRDEQTTAARVTARPFAGGQSLLEPLHAAVAFTAGETAERLTRPGWIHGARRRAGIELRWRTGPLGVTGEYIRATDERLGQSATGDNLPAISSAGWYVAGIWTVRRAVRSEGPRVELATRIEGLRVGGLKADATTAINPRAPIASGPRERALTVGVNCHLNRWVKLQADGVRTTRSDNPDRTALWTSTVRFQISI
jgi:phosphate-selective porin